MAEEVDFEEEMGEIITETGKAGATERIIASKGRGHTRTDEDDVRYDGRGGVFERIEQTSGPGPLQCNLFVISNMLFKYLYKP